LVVVLLVALGLRLGWGLTRPAGDAAINALPDQREYLSIASSLLHGEGLAFVDKRFDDRVFAFRMPGYPIFLAACAASPRVARAVQAVIDTFTVLAVYLLAAMLTPSSPAKVGLVAAWIVALNPYLIYFSSLLLSESLATAMLVWAMYLIVRGGGGLAPTWGQTLAWLGGCVILALSILVRPSAIGLAVAVPLAGTLVNRRGTPPYQNPDGSAVGAKGCWPLPAGASALLLVAIVLTPWTLRNFRVLGRWIVLDTNSGFTLYDGYNPDATGGSDQSFVDREPQLQVLGEVNRSEYLSAKAWQFASERPAQCMRLAVAKLGRMWSPVPLSSEYARPAYQWIALLYSVPFDILIVLGVLRGGMSRTAKFLLLTPALYFSIVHALTVGSLRYRMPAEPVLAVLAASPVVAGAGRNWKRAEPS
jgi:hypothetical protein